MKLYAFVNHAEGNYSWSYYEEEAMKLEDHRANSKLARYKAARETVWGTRLLARHTVEATTV